MNQLEIVPNDTNLETPPVVVKSYNTAQKLLMSLGGLAALVVEMSVYSRVAKSVKKPKKVHQRGRTGTGYYGYNLKATFDAKRKRDKEAAK